MSKFTDKDASIATLACQKVAIDLLKIELESEAIKLPAAVAKRLEVIEARYEMLCKRLLSQALLPYVAAIDIDLPEQSAVPEGPPNERVSSGGKTEEKPKKNADTLKDEFDF